MFGISRFGVFFSYVFPWVGGLLDSFYPFALLFFWCYLMLLRVPYVFDMGDYFFFLLGVVFPLFLCLMFFRFLGNWRYFLAGFISSGLPFWIAPFVCLVETFSYLIRPLVMLVRPFVNVSVGVYGAFSLAYVILDVSFCWSVLLLLFLFYEIFVALVHWFIVCEILSFSVNH
nr:ATP synthase F0 subunit 6 [Strigea falconis]